MKLGKRLFIFLLALSFQVMGEATVDSSFNNVGVSYSTFSYPVLNKASCESSSGLIAVVGVLQNPSNGDIAVSLFSKTSGLVKTFGANGKVVLDSGATSDVPTGCTFQDDGKLLVAAYKFAGTNDKMGVFRVKTDGSLDTGFNGSGMIFDEISNMTAQGRRSSDIYDHGDGTLELTGTQIGRDYAEFIISMRLNRSDGTLLTSFDGDGKKYIQATGSSIIIHKSIKHPVAGQFLVGSDGAKLMTVKMNASFNLDTAFNTTGFNRSSTNGYFKCIKTHLEGSEYKIYAAGYKNVGNVEQAIINKYNPEGTPDTSFGGTGSVSFTLGLAHDKIIDLQVLANGDVLVLGESYQNFSYRPFFYMLNSGGMVINSFGTAGASYLSLDSKRGLSVTGFYVQSNQEVFLTGSDDGLLFVKKFKLTY